VREQSINRPGSIHPRVTTQVFTVPTFYWILAVEVFCLGFWHEDQNASGLALGKHRQRPQSFVPQYVAIIVLTSYPHGHAGTRRHKEIFGHQRGGPILEVATLTLTIRQAEGIARDSARSIPDRHISWNNGAMRYLQESFEPAGWLRCRHYPVIVILLFKT
jgi:hypothetical protein